MENHGHSPVSFVQALTLLFIGLKLTNHIDWSWWWVLTPIIVSIVVGTIVEVGRTLNKEMHK